QPLDDASVVLTVRAVTNGFSQSPLPADRLSQTNAGWIRLGAEPSSTEPGVYEATYVPRETGGYLADAAVTDAAGIEVGRAQAGWTADPAADEFRSLKPNRSLLETLARQTGGEVVASAGLDAFAANLPNRKAPITESWTVPLWHRSAVFLFALACFVAEWGLRRSKGMV
ncbi:MAG TPA: hypothetical protein VN887_11290, partial [Candidatus Angelobacter sp.]|nr:hypothetical protein [Candidatus Angelobacter sp.]